MDRPRLSLAVNWRDFEKAAHGVFLDALKRLCQYKRLPTAEPSISLEVFHLALAAHQDQYQAGTCLYQFTIEPDATSKPQPDDAAPDSRLRKRPDFACTMKDMQAVHPSLSQVSYYLECKRLGRQEGDQVFNDLYSEKGIARFMTEEHQYAKGCESAAMIGFVEDMEPDAVLREVNAFATGRAIPSLTKAAAGWMSGEATVLPGVSLNRSFDTNPILLHHFWVDLRGCKLDVPSDHPPQAAGNPLPGTAAEQPGKTAVPAPPAVTKRPAQHIAILGWGSLLWDPDADFDSQHGDWQKGGPTLKIEFSRISTTKRPGVLTLVIDEVNGSPVPVSWCLSKRGSVAAVQKDLREREGTKADDIKVIRVDEPHGPFPAGSVEATIADWAKQNSLTAVVWTGLRSNFQQTNSDFTPAAALTYLKGLKTARKNKAVEYIRNAPAFVQTAFRTAFEADSDFVG
jgi:hypothetical protein